jgi:hypothetical protein
MSLAHVFPILLGCLFIWGGYRRVRRNIGQQPLHPRRALTSITILSVISVAIIYLSLADARLLLGFGGGLLPGALLGLLGLRLTRFETNASGHFYTPNTHIGIALSALFVGRMVYRLVVLGGTAAAQNHAPPFQSPLTLLILGLTVAYYLVYQTGLLLHSRDKK